MRVILTGATGFIGSHVVTELARCGVPTTSLVRNTASFHCPVQGDVIEVSYDSGLLSPRIFENADSVIHVAGAGLRRISDDPTFNERSTELILQALESNRSARFYYLSTVKASDPSADSYARGKYLAEQMVDTALGKHGRTGAIIRVPAVFGGGDLNFLPMFKLAARGWLPRVAFSEGPRFSLLYVKSLARNLVALATGTLTDQGVIYWADPAETAWNELVRALTEASPRPIRRIALPESSWRLAFGLVAAAGGIPRERVADVFSGKWRVPHVNSMATGACCLNKAFAETWRDYVLRGWLV